MQRRKFVKKATLGSIAGFIGAEVVYSNLMPKGYTLLALQEPDPFKMFMKDPEMVVLNDKPWNMEAMAHLLDDKVT
ncbi:MAG: molybdopterin containing oxidoreductase, partial [Flavobacteriaceae bacterium]